MNNKIIIALLVVASLGGYFTYKQKQKTNSVQTQKELTSNESIETKTLSEKPKDNNQDSKILAQEQKPTVTNDDSIVAKTNYKQYSKKEITDRMKMMFGGRLPENKTDLDQMDSKAKDEIIKNIIISDLLFDESEKSNLNSSEEFKKFLAERTKEAHVSFYVEALVKQNINDDRIKQEYEKLSKEWINREQIKASHILVDNQDEAKKIQQKLTSGSSFEDLAKEYSKDGTKDKGGDLGYFTKEQMVPAFSEAAFALKIGQISEPIKTDFGWHIIKLIDRKKVDVPTFDSVKMDIKRNLSQEFIGNYIKDTLSKSNFEIIKQ